MKVRNVADAKPVGRRWRLTGAVCAATVGMMITAGCEVTNPGPVQDEFLFAESSHAPLVAGAERRLAQLIKNLAYDGALMSRELFPTGQIGAHGHPVTFQGGHLPDNDTYMNGRWNFGQQARWIAENALERFIEDGAIPPEEQANNPLITDAHITAAFATRIMGEHWCDAVLDGGAPESNEAWFQRAEEHFTAAIGMAPDAQRRDAATAGRAQVRMWLGDWAGAVSDAQQISTDFNHSAVMDADPDGARNRIWFSTVDLPYRTITTWNSWQYEYYNETGDPRVPSVDPGLGFSTGALSGFGQVPFRRQLKYPNGDSDMRLAGGVEMRLIEAEALLREGTWEPAMDLINEVRTRNVSDITGQPMEAWSASSLEEAWEYLKRERFIEFWLEGRRMGDMRRWEDTGAPGAIDWMDFESMSPIFAQNPRSRCYTIPTNERNANPNVPVELPTDIHFASPGDTPGQG